MGSAALALGSYKLNLQKYLLLEVTLLYVSVTQE